MWTLVRIPQRLRLPIGGAVCVFAAGALAGCGFHPDPTEHNFYVRVVNDTARPVVLSTCGTGDTMCSKTFQTGRVEPGKAWPSVQASVGAVDVVLVRNARGAGLGCLPLHFGYNADGMTVRVSEVVPCSHSYPERRSRSTRQPRDSPRTPERCGHRLRAKTSCRRTQGPDPLPPSSCPPRRPLASMRIHARRGRDRPQVDLHDPRGRQCLQSMHSGQPHASSIAPLLSRGGGRGLAQPMHGGGEWGSQETVRNREKFVGGG